MFVVVVFLMFLNSALLLVCLFVCVSCCYLPFVFCFFRDISLNTYVIQGVGFSGLSVILLNLWKT